MGGASGVVQGGRHGNHEDDARVWDACHPAFLADRREYVRPAAQPYLAPPFNNATAPEYAIATGGHDWTQVDFMPSSLHVVDAIERAPGDIYLTGGAVMHTDACANALGALGSLLRDAELRTR